MEILTIQSKNIQNKLIITELINSNANGSNAIRSKEIGPKAIKLKEIRSKDNNPRINRSVLVGKSIFVGLILLASTPLLEAQDYSTTLDAFQESYIQEATGDVPAAINSLKTVYDENSYELNLRLGWLSYQTGNFTESTAYYSKAIDLMPYAVEPRFGVVYPGAAMGNWSMVLKQYDKILEITPNNSIAMHRLGLIYYGREEYEKARQYFDKVVNLYPFDYDALTMLAWSHFRLQNMREARVLFQKALLNTPSGSSALEGLDLVK